jgi:hypothetical protein
MGVFTSAVRSSLFDILRFSPFYHLRPARGSLWHPCTGKSPLWLTEYRICLMESVRKLPSG